MRSISVSIIFPTHNSGREPLKCLESIAGFTYPKSKIEIVVIDNGSTDGTSVRVRRKYPNIKLIKNIANVSFAKAINQGLKIASGQFILITNDDVIFEKNCLTRLIQYLDEHPDTGIVGGKIYSKTSPSTVTSAGFVFNRWTGEVSEKSDRETVIVPDWIQGCALLVRRAVIEDIGPFDEGFTYFFEDFDLCLRAKKAGWKIAGIPSAILWHGGSTTFDRNLPQKYTHWYQAKIRFILKHLPFINVLSMLLFQTLLVMPYRALILRDGRMLPFLKGVIWNISHLSQTITSRYEKTV